MTTITNMTDHGLTGNARYIVRSADGTLRKNQSTKAGLWATDSHTGAALRLYLTFKGAQGQVDALRYRHAGLVVWVDVLRGEPVPVLNAGRDSAGAAMRAALAALEPPVRLSRRDGARMHDIAVARLERVLARADGWASAVERDTATDLAERSRADAPRAAR